jgi:hypothetical protein
VAALAAVIAELMAITEAEREKLQRRRHAAIGKGETSAELAGRALPPWSFLVP